MALSLSLATAGLGTAAHFSPDVAVDSMTAVNDTILEEDVEEDLETLDDEDADDEFGDFGEDVEEGAEKGDSPVVHSNAPEVVPDSTDTGIELTEGMMVDVDSQLKEWDFFKMSILKSLFFLMTLAFFVTNLRVQNMVRMLLSQDTRKQQHGKTILKKQF